MHLVRKEITVTEKELPDAFFAQEVSDKLSYNFLQNKLTAENDSNIILQHLKEKDIRPFFGAVTYMDKTTKDINKNRVRLGYVFLIIGIISFIMYGLFSSPIFPIVGGVLCVTSFGIAVSLSDKDWQLKPLNYHQKYIPEFVLQTALDIKTEFKNVQFYVTDLDNFKGRFLCLQLPNGRQLYLEKWMDE